MIKNSYVDLKLRQYWNDSFPEIEGKVFNETKIK